jgi:hypothetical protein
MSSRRFWYEFVEMHFLATTSLHSDDLDNSTMTSTATPILAALRRLWAYLLPSGLVDFFAVANLDDEHYVGRLDRVDNAPILYTQPPCPLEAVPQRLAKLDGVRCEFLFYGPPDSVANVLG